MAARFIFGSFDGTSVDEWSLSGVTKLMIVPSLKSSSPQSEFATNTCQMPSIFVVKMEATQVQPNPVKAGEFSLFLRLCE